MNTKLVNVIIKLANGLEVKAVRPYSNEMYINDETCVEVVNKSIKRAPARKQLFYINGMREKVLGYSIDKIVLDVE